MSDQTPLTADDIVETFTAPTPKAVQELRAAQPERRLYQTTGFEDVIGDKDFEGSEAPPEMRQAAVKEMRNVLYDLGLSPADARAMINRAAELKGNTKTVEEARKEARIELARNFGSLGPKAQAEADAALMDARRLVLRDQRFAFWLERKGLGNDAQTLIQLAKLARSQRQKGFLK